MVTSLQDIPELAKKTAKTLKGGEIFALTGPLGSGKTTFTQVLGKELKIKHKITSPTFALMNSFPIKLGGKEKHLFHLDLYRTESIKEVKALGVTEFWGKNNCVVIIEWADKIKNILPKKTKWIEFVRK